MEQKILYHVSSSIHIIIGSDLFLIICGSFSFRRDIFYCFDLFMEILYIVAQRYLPGKERKSPYHLELILRLPPQSVTKFSIEMEYSFLKWQEYPPDANHGFYMGPAIITALLPIARNYSALPLDGSTITSRLKIDYINQ